MRAPSGDNIVTIVFFAAATGLAIRGLAWNYIKGLLARGWLTYQGTVEYGSIEERRVRYVRYYVARLDYSYTVNGEYYSGHMERTFFWESSADRFVSGLKGQLVFVRSNPVRPERSALLKQDQHGSWPS